MTDIDTQKTDEAEIDLLDLFLVLLKYKWFILLATILPTVVIGLILSKLPKDYKTSYTYKVEINDTELRVLQDIFYSKENLQKLTKKIQSCELKNIIPNLTTGTLKQSVRFEILPSLFYTNTRTFDELLEQKNAKGAYLLLQICHESKEVLQKIAPVYRENFEKVIPLYAEKNRLIYGKIDATSQYLLKNNEGLVATAAAEATEEEKEGIIIGIQASKFRLASIETKRHILNLEMESKKMILEHLKKLGPEDVEKSCSNIVVQFENANKNSTYLPLPYQIQALQSQLIILEADIRKNGRLYDYYTDLLELDQAVLEQLDNMLRSHSTIQDFLLYLDTLLTESTKVSPYLQDHLNAYIRLVENNIIAALPVIENPAIFSTAKAIHKKVSLVFIITLLLSIFGVFIYEGVQKRLLARQGRCPTK